MRPHILIVEDDPATREALSLLLNAQGYITSEAANGSEALHRLRADGPHRLVLLDMVMPVMDGWQFLAARHNEPTLGAVPVIVFTAAGGLDAPDVRALGAEDCLQKPAAAEDVLEAVRRHCPAPDP